MKMLRSAGYALAVAFWVTSGFYTLLASRQFIVEQFLKPDLFPPLTVFARLWPAWSLVALVCWAAPRWGMISRIDLRSAITIGAWVATVIAWPFTAAAWPLSWCVVAIFMTWMVPFSEYPAIRNTTARSTSNAAADFLACVAAAAVVIAIEAAIGFARGGGAGISKDVIAAVCVQPLIAMAVFLAMTVIRGMADAWLSPAAGEARLTIATLGLLFGVFLDHVVLTSISAASLPERVGAYVAGYVLASALTVGAIIRFHQTHDGLRNVIGSFAPRVTAKPLLLIAWLLFVGLLAIGFDRITQAADWNFVVARGGVIFLWLFVLAGAVRAIRGPAGGSSHAFVAIAALILAAHVAADRWVVDASTLEARAPATRWALTVLRSETAGPSEFFDLLAANTNLTGSAGQPVNVEWAPLDGAPSAERPNIFVFIVDSLRRDYVSPYNDAVTFTPSIGAFARESIVFDRAFTQYGATGLSVPSIWIGGPLLHKQYVTPFAPMNALAKLIDHEQYAQWVSMDNILDVILPRTPALEPLDAGVPVKDFRFCRTLDEVRSRLASRAPDAPPVFAYSLPQDIHVSVVAREGSRSVDSESYGNFSAPVASRIRRFDACFGSFVADLKTAGLFDHSVIVLTSDHGDSLGEGGRIGHAYTLYPEIVRVPLIVHVPAALRDRFAWDPARIAYTTDLTPTLYRLLGHDVTAPDTFYGEPLMRAAGTTPPPRDRMLASSYGSVYGALMRGGTQLFVANAVERREMAFDIGPGPSPGREVPLDPATRQLGTEVITATVASLAKTYRVAQ